MKIKNNPEVSLETKQKILQRDNFTCQKCGFQDPSSEELEIHHISPKVFNGSNSPENLITLCSICHNYAPDSEEKFRSYINEKIDSKILDTFRKSQYSISKRTKQGMTDKLNEGRHLTKAPRGYKIINKELIINQEKAKEVREIFKEFLDKDISLTKLAKEHSMTTAGIKKLLQNTTYIGKVKFANQESKGKHELIIHKEIFDKTQAKLKQISFNTALKKNIALVGNILIQGDSRYYDYYEEKILAHFLTKKAIIAEEKQITEINEPKDKDLEKINDPQKLAKYVALILLKNEGFTDPEIFFERYFGSDKPDVSALNKEKQIFVECFSCRVNKVIDYLTQNRELWVLTSGAYPWDKKPISSVMEWFVFKRGSHWNEVFQEHKRKQSEKIKQDLEKHSPFDF